MRELRIFELDEPGHPVGLRAGYGQSVKVLEGRLWVTEEGRLADFWLQPGEVFELAEGGRFWLSGDGAVRFMLAETPAPLSLRRLVAWLRLLHQRWAEHKTDAFGECPRLGVQ